MSVGTSRSRQITPWLGAMIVARPARSTTFATALETCVPSGMRMLA